MKLIHKVEEKMKKGETFFSFEFFPPRTEEVGKHGLIAEGRLGEDGACGSRSLLQRDAYI